MIKVLAPPAILILPILLPINARGGNNKVQNLNNGRNLTQGMDVLTMSNIQPKEYDRLSNTEAFKQDEDKVMNFGFFKFFSQILLHMMIWVHRWTGNWGVAIIVTTLLIKIGSLPFTIKAAKASSEEYWRKPNLKIGNSLISRVVKEKAPLMVRDVTKQEGYQYPELAT